MKSITKKYGSHIKILTIVIVPFSWFFAPLIVFFNKYKERKEIDEKLEKLTSKIVHHKPYFYSDEYPKGFKSRLLSGWESEKNEIVNQMVLLGEQYTTQRQTRLLRLITLRIYYFEAKI
jgi:hypothetical protein